MNFKEVDYSSIGGYKHTKLQKILEDFISADIKAAEVIDIDDYAQPSSAVASIKASIKRYKLGSTINCITKDGKVYLINLTKGE